ncbi:MAG: hypothetical protein KDB25_06865 [Leucobacter sp.]|nr:hypothetical protein [Leucobacter sp.]
MLTACYPSTGGYGGSSSDSDRSSLYEQVEPEVPAFSEPEVSWPKNGYGTVGNGGDGCLEISVPTGSKAYYVKLKKGSSTVWDVFLKPGSSKEFSVPTGTYDLTYGAGDHWYGSRYAFGPEGVYSEASERFTFDPGSCWTVELILRPGGNLGSSGLDYDDF